MKNKPQLSRRRRWAGRLLKLALASFFLLLLVLVGGYIYIARDLPSPDNLIQHPPAQSTRIYDRNGTLLYEFYDPRAGRRNAVSLAEIPLDLRNATIASEDTSFYQNPGIDPKGMARALWLNIRGGHVVAGGSTITQQLTRNALFSSQERDERTFLRKMRETILAYQINQRYSKDQILTMYLNEVYYGNLSYGVDAAARAYFAKPASQLDLAECAMIAGLPQSPDAFDPTQHPEAAKIRQQEVLDAMVSQGYISKAQADAAAAEPLYYASNAEITAPHFSMYVRSLLEQQYGREMAYNGGLRVTTTLDSGLENLAQRVVEFHLTQLKNKNVQNGAVLAIDPSNGEILVMVGSRNFQDAQIAGQVNMTTALRQPGSSVKPFTYALSFMRGWSPATLIWDVPTDFPDRSGWPYHPQNYDLRYHGPVSVRTALANSYNVPAVKTLQFVGVPAFIEQAQRLGMTSYQDAGRYGLSLTLGGGETSLLQLTGAYTVFPRGGNFIPPVAILDVEDSNGHSLYHYTPPAGSTVFGPQSAQIAYQITSILSDDQARIPSYGLYSPLSLERPAAAKTGTTTEWRDNWTVGYTPDLVTGVWVGNSDNSAMINSTGVTGAAPIWHDFMLEALKARPALDFKRPAGLTDVVVCNPSGLLPSPDCSNQLPEIFLAGHEPKEEDNLYKRVKIDTATGNLATANCPHALVKAELYLVFPPETRDWAIANDFPQPPEVPCPTEAGSMAGTTLTSPGPAAFVNGIVTLTGDAFADVSSAGKSSYTIEVAPGAFADNVQSNSRINWRSIGGASLAVHAGTLGRWDTTGEKDGIYTIRLRVSDGAGTTHETRSIVTIDNTPPTIHFLYPQPGMHLSISQDGAVPLQAQVEDNLGIALVEYYVDGQRAGDRQAPPYTIAWTLDAVSPGPHTINVIVHDRAGNVTQSPPLNVIVDP